MPNIVWTRRGRWQPRSISAQMGGLRATWMGDAYEKEREKEKEKSRQSNQWGNRAIPSVRQVKRRSNTPRANGEPAVTNDD